MIHPNQIEICNDIFSPSVGEVEYAKRVVVAFEDARVSGKSVAILDGKLIENLHHQEATDTISIFNQIELLRKDRKKME